MKIILLFSFFLFAYPYTGKSSLEGDREGSATPAGQTASTVSSGARDTVFVTNVWQNLLDDEQKKLFTSKVGPLPQTVQVLNAFCMQYNQAKKLLAVMPPHLIY